MKLTPEASMRMRASPGPGVGVGRSRRVRTSAEPVVRVCMAWMLDGRVQHGPKSRVTTVVKTTSTVKGNRRFLPLRCRIQTKGRQQQGNDKSRSPTGMTSKKDKSKRKD